MTMNIALKTLLALLATIAAYLGLMTSDDGAKFLLATTSFLILLFLVLQDRIVQRIIDRLRSL